MRHGDFCIGKAFTSDTGQWRCTDIGTRTITAIKISEVHVARLAEDGCVVSETVSTDSSWFEGPPYAVAELVFDEDDMGACRAA